MTEHQPGTLDPDASDAAKGPVVRLCNLALREALASGADQLRLGPAGPEFGSVEFEIGGVWKPAMSVPVQAHRVMVAHLKTIASLDAAGQGALRIKLKDYQHAAAVTVPHPGSEDSIVVALGPAT